MTLRCPGCDLMFPAEASLDDLERVLKAHDAETEHLAGALRRASADGAGYAPLNYRTLAAAIIAGAAAEPLP